MADTTELHEAVKRGDVERIHALLREEPALANAVSESDPRRTYPLHVAAEFNQPEAAKVLLQYGADVALTGSENEAIALGWAAFFGRPAVVAVLLDAGSNPNQRNKHGLTPLKCAVEGVAGRWRQLSKAAISDWQESVDSLRARGAAE